MKSDEHLCFFTMSLQFPSNLSFAEFTLTPLNQPLCARYRISTSVTYNFELMGWKCHFPAPAVERKAELPLRATGFVAGVILYNQRFPLLFFGKVVVSLRIPRLAMILEFICPGPWCFLPDPSSPPTPILSCCPCSLYGREAGALPDRPGLDWLTSCHRT